MTKKAGLMKEVAETLEKITEPGEKWRYLLSITRELPKDAESLESYQRTEELLLEIEPPEERRIALQALLPELPLTSAFLELYKNTFLALVDTTEHIEDPRA
ncbi:MAG: hypothetical protein IME98_02760, partial [Proteobacteria bacterium]|nr:hypothetical protein [Pseudomonadota bacterium]